ncbi:MAG: hypothetical protein NTX81_02385 [Candidatus Bathyarchaeota archaeon]|nr:hypothetical protein [Candidatus Bathyarchaeota archaeon]
MPKYDEYRESLRRFNEKVDQVLRSNCYTVEDNLGSLVDFCETDDTVRIVTRRLKDNRVVDVDNWYNGLVKSAQKFELPKDREYRVALLYQLLLKMVRGHIDPADLARTVFPSRMNDLNFYVGEFNSNMLVPFAQGMEFLMEKENRESRLTPKSDDSAEMRRADLEMTIPPEITKSRDLFSQDYSDPSKVGFIMMKFRKTPAHDRIVEAIRNTLKLCDLKGVRSDDKEYHQDLYYNVLTHMHGCGFGIAVFDQIQEESFSPNVSLEIGYMLALGKKICILKDKNLKTMPADLLGKLYKEFDPQNPEKTIDDSLSKWLSDNKIGQRISIMQEVQAGTESDEMGEISLEELLPEELAMLRSLPPTAHNVRLYRRRDDGSVVMKYQYTD